LKIQINKNMKNFILTSVCAVGFAGAALAQGSIEWNGVSFTAVTAETNTTVSSYVSPGGSKALLNGTTGLAGAGAAGSYYYELLYSANNTAAPTTLAGLDGWTDTGLLADNSGNGGRLQVPAADNTPAAIISALSPTTSYAIILVGWSANLGTSWASASTILNSPTALASVVGSAFFGETSVADNWSPNPSTSSPGQSPFGAGAIVSLLTPLYPVSVPEPTTLALGAMGALSLLALRRKKA
jgi:hypothetical protein